MLRFVLSAAHAATLEQRLFFIHVACMLHQLSQLTSSCSFFLGYQILRCRCVAYFAKLYGVVEYVRVPRWFSQGLPLKARIIKIRAIDALYRWIPLLQVHFSVRSAQRLAPPNIRTGCRSCERVLVAAVEVPAPAHELKLRRRTTRDCALRSTYNLSSHLVVN